jgi:hypothetical protein
LKILITGNRGFIGSHAERFWRKLGTDDCRHEIHTYEWNEQLLPRIEGLDWVLHFGAISSTTERDVAKVMRQNYDFSVWLYEECRKYDVDMQWSSSASVYGSGLDFSETAPVDPRSTYSWSKYLFEHYTEKNPTHRRCQGFRYFNVYGENEQHKGSQASPHYQFALQAQVNGVIRVFEGSHNMRRDFVPVDLVIDHSVAVDFYGQKDSYEKNVALEYERNPEKIANLVYGNRMGNGTEATGEGFKFRGRGYIQLTGKANYQLFDKVVAEDLISNPDLVATKYPLLSAAWFFHKNDLHKIADEGATDSVVTKITKRVNGGTNGLADRLKQFKEFYNLLK